MPAKTKAILITVATVVLGVVGMATGADWWVEYLWLEALGYESVFWTIRSLKVGLLLIAFIPIFAYFWINFRSLSAHLDLAALYDDYQTNRSRIYPSIDGGRYLTDRHSQGGKALD